MARPNRKTIRLKLSDFIQTKIESEVVESLKKIQNYSGVHIILWYNNTDINTKDVEKFKTTYQDMFLKDNIYIYNHNGNRDFIWYDISNRGDCHENDNHKFRSYYSVNTEILNCLTQVSNYVRFANNK